MKQKKDEKLPHEPRDRPVPPVKGAVTMPEDVILRPDTAAQQGILSGPQAATDFDSWL